MSTFNAMNEKTKILLAHKEKLLEDLKYCEKRIELEREKLSQSNSFEYDDSSDSDTDSLLHIESGPSVIQLREKRDMLSKCLQATQELTGLEVLQSEISGILEEPKLHGELPVTEPGTWREVTAECCVDLVPFTITFYVHTATRKFGPASYRALKVAPVKRAHDVELSQSVLPAIKRPSDAIEVIRSYAVAHRSRRTTLARLADKFAESLFMEAMPEGGYMLKCANLLEVSWTLQNKWSPITPFHHRLKFDLEYMDESYIKTITQAHRQLSDPAIDTDERTLLLARIISTCLEARPDQSSDHESVVKTTLDKEPDVPTVKSKDSEVMAPPKSLPRKRSGDKGRVKRLGGTVKKARSSHSQIDGGKEKTGNVESSSGKDNKSVEKKVADKNNEAKKTGNIESLSGKDNDGVTLKSAEKNNEANTIKAKVIQVAQKKVEDSVGTKKNDGAGRLDVKEQESVASKKYAEDTIASKASKGKTTNVARKTEDSVAVEKNEGAGSSEAIANKESVAVTKNAGSDVASDKNINKGKAKIVKKVIKKKLANKSTGEVAKKVKKVISSNNIGNTSTQKIISNIRNIASDGKILEKKTVDTAKMLPKVKNKPPQPTSNSKETNVASKPKTNTEKTIKVVPKKIEAANKIKSSKIITKTTESKPQNTIKKLPLKTFNKPKVHGNIDKNLKTSNTEKENNSQNSVGSQKMSKIPQKKLTTVTDFLKNNPVRHSPRKLVATGKMISKVSTITKLKPVSKPPTNIPRPFSKPKPKAP